MQYKYAIQSSIEQSDGQDPQTFVEGPQKVVDVADVIKKQGYMLVIEDVDILSGEQPKVFAIQENIIHNADFQKGMDQEKQSADKTVDLDELEGCLNELEADCPVKIGEGNENIE